jgi:iron complex outermembrane receptor protein
MRTFMMASVSAAAVLTAGLAHAQTAAPTAPQATPEAATGVEDIIVTAQRRSESLQRVPVSVTAVTAETLTSRNINDLNQVAIAAPSLQIGTTGAFSIRGVGTLALASSVDSSVAIAIDEVNLGRPNLSINLFNDVARVEVLNGPQGLLFGRNASAGLLNIVTARPILGQFHNTFGAEVASFDRPGASDDGRSTILRETVNLPLTEGSALRLNGFYSKADAVSTVLGATTARRENDPEQWGVRAKYLNEFSDKLSLYVIADYAESHGAPSNTYRSVGPAPSMIAPRLAADGITAGPENFQASGKGDFYQDLINRGLQATLSYRFDTGLELSDIVAWKDVDSNKQFDTDLVSADGLDINHNVNSYHQISNELRLALPAGNRLGGQAGLYYFHAETNSVNETGGGLFIPAAAQPNAPFCVGATATPGCAVRNLRVVGRDWAYDLDNTSYAAFGQLTYALTGQLTLIAGARLTRDELSINQRQNQNNYFRALGVRASFDQNTDNTNFSWKLGAQYQITPAVMAYATVGRGYKGPGTNDNGATATSNLIVDPETSDNIEAGVKSRLFNNRLVLNASVFHTKFENYQSQSFNAAVTAFIIQNAASLTSQGAEFTLIANPIEGLTINGSIAVLDSSFDSFPGAQCYPGQPTAGCSTGGSFDASGFDTPTTPKFTSSLQAAYEWPVSNGLNGFVQANYYHRSTINYNINAAAGAEVGPIDVFGASAGVRFDNGARISVFCNNCTNEHYPLNIGSDPIDATVNVASFVQSFGPDSVRKIGLSATFEY